MPLAGRPFFQGQADSVIVRIVISVFLSLNPQKLINIEHTLCVNGEHHGIIEKSNGGFS